jgi:hypothetical protein
MHLRTRKIKRRAALLVAICAIAAGASLSAHADPYSCSVPGSSNGFGDTFALYTRITCG